MKRMKLNWSGNSAQFQAFTPPLKPHSHTASPTSLQGKNRHGNPAASYPTGIT